jgi:hypothetical protein
MCLTFIKGYSQESVTVSGGDATGSGGSSSYSIGQITYISQTGSGGLITLGVQQPYEIVTLGNEDFTDINLIMSAYPNPTTDVLNLVTRDNELGNLTYQLFDISGKIISNDQKISASETAVPMQSFSHGIYFLVVKDSQKIVKTFKIIKK